MLCRVCFKLMVNRRCPDGCPAPPASAQPQGNIDPFTGVDIDIDTAIDRAVSNGWLRRLQYGF